MDLYEKYGDYNVDGYFIIDHKKWHHYAENDKLYQKKKRQANLYMLIPIIGIILKDLTYEEMGLSVF